MMKLIRVYSFLLLLVNAMFFAPCPVVAEKQVSVKLTVISSVPVKVFLNGERIMDVPQNGNITKDISASLDAELFFKGKGFEKRFELSDFYSDSSTSINIKIGREKDSDLRLDKDEYDKSLMVDKKVSKEKVELLIQNGHTSSVNGVLLTKDEKTLISWSDDNTIKIWNRETGRLLKTLEGHTGWVNGVLLAKDEKTLFSWSYDKTIRIWNVETGESKTLVGYPDSVFGVLLSKDAKTLISWGKDETIRIWNRETGMLHILWDTTEPVLGVLLSNDEKTLISWAGYTIRIWNREDGKLLHTLQGHTTHIRGVLLSNDEKTLFSWSDDKTIRIWNREDGKLLKTLEGHTVGVNGVILSKDEKTLFSWSDDKTIRIWKIKENFLFLWERKINKLLHTLQGHTVGVNGVILSKDEKTLISWAGGDETIRIWNREDGKLLKTLEGHTVGVNGVILSKDEKTIISWAGDRTIRIWNREDGKLLKTLEGHTNSVQRVLLSKDEKTLFAWADDKILGDGTIRIWNREDGKLLHTLQDATNTSESIEVFGKDEKIFILTFYNDQATRIWNQESGKLPHTLKGHTRYVKGVIISKDEKTLISWYWNQSKIQIWNLYGKLLRTLKGFGAIVSKDEKTIFSWYVEIQIWNRETGKLLNTLKGHTSLVKGVLLTKDEKTLFSWSYDKTIRIWNRESGKLLKTLEGHTDDVNGMILSKDEKTLFSWSYDKTIRIWNVETGKLLKTLEGHTSSVRVLLTKDEKTLFSWAGYSFDSKDHTIRIWNVETGKLLKTLEGHTDYVYEVILSKDEKTLFSWSDDKTIRIWNRESGKLLKTLSHKVVLSKDEKTIISWSDDKTIRIWNRESGKLLKTLEGHTDDVNGVILSKDEKTLISWSLDKTIQIWNFETGKLLYILKGNPEPDNGVFLSKDEKTLFSWLDDKTIRIWNISTGKELAALLSFKDGEGLVYTPEGEFDYTSSKAKRYVSYKIGNKFMDFNDMDKYRHPGLLRKILSGEYEPRGKAEFEKSIRDLPLVKIISPDPQMTISSYEDKVSILFELREKDSQISRVEAWVNGRYQNTADINPKEEKHKITVPLAESINRIEIKAYNSQKKPLPGKDTITLHKETDKRPEVNLYVLSVGVNDYKEEHKLNYSVKDAEEFNKLIKEKSEGIYTKVETFLLRDKEASRKAIFEKLDYIGKKAKTNDAVIIYLSGHGQLVTKSSGGSLYYYVPQDFEWVDLEKEDTARDFGVDAEKLAEYLELKKIHAHKVVLFIDSCHSGGSRIAFKSGEDDKEQFDKLANGTGVFLFTSSSGNQKSRENDKIQMGLFTYVLKKGVYGYSEKIGKKNKTYNADINGDGYISVTELGSFVQIHFEKLTKGLSEGYAQNPVYANSGRDELSESVNDFSIAKVKK